MYRKASRSNGNGGARASVGSLLPIRIKKLGPIRKRLVLKRLAVPQPPPAKSKAEKWPPKPRKAKGQANRRKNWLAQQPLKKYPPLRLPAGLYDHIPDHIPDPAKNRPARPAEKRPATRSDRLAPLKAAPKKLKPKEPKERRDRKQPVFVRLPDRKLTQRPPRSYVVTDQ